MSTTPLGRASMGRDMVSKLGEDKMKSRWEVSLVVFFFLFKTDWLHINSRRLG